MSQFQWNILLWHDQTQEHEFECFYTVSIHKNHFKKQHYGTEPVSETFKISKFWWNILLWHGQTQKHEFGYFYTMLVHKNYFKKEKYETESFLRNIQNFWYSIRLFTVTWPNVAQTVGSFQKIYLHKTTVKKKTMRQGDFRKCSRCHRFSKIFQCVINRRMNTNPRIFR